MSILIRRDKKRWSITQDFDNIINVKKSVCVWPERVHDRFLFSNKGTMSLREDLATLPVSRNFHHTGPTVDLALNQTWPTFDRNPMSLICPRCQEDLVTDVELTCEFISYLIGLSICCFGGFFSCCLIPCCIHQCLDTKHRCPACTSLVEQSKFFSNKKTLEVVETTH